MTVRVGINGFGRIGRSFTRALLARGADAGVELVAVNDPMGDSETMAFLLKHDSVGGTLPERGRGERQRLRDRRPRGPQARGDGPGRDPVERPRRRRRHRVDRHLHRPGEGGAVTSAAASERVIISAPSGDADATICMGVNDDGVRRGAAHRDLERVVHHQLPRAAGQGAERPVRHRAGPHDHGARLHERPVARGPRQGDPQRQARPPRACAPRPVDHPEQHRRGACDRARAARAQGQARRHRAAGADADRLDHRPHREPRPRASRSTRSTSAFAEAAADPSYRGVLEYSEEQLVSADIVGNPASCIFSAEDTMANGRMVKVLGWYDNEWGYSNRLVDLVAFVARVAPDPRALTMPADLPRLEDLPIRRGTARAAPRRLQRPDDRRAHRRRPAHHDACSRRSSGCATGSAVVVALRAPRAARREASTRSTPWRRSRTRLRRAARSRGAAGARGRRAPRRAARGVRRARRRRDAREPALRPR